jgi:hypothetical protein
MALAMISFDRRASDRRGVTSSTTTVNLGGVLAYERRERRDRRQHPRRRNDFDSIAHVASRIKAGQTRLEVMVDGSDGMRLVAMFVCGCRATEPIGSGTPAVFALTCADHAPPVIVVERRRYQR